MDASRKIGVGIALLAIFGAIAARVLHKTPVVIVEPDMPKGAFYYSGPIKQKGGDVYASEGGQFFTESAANQSAAEYQRQHGKSP